MSRRDYIATAEIIRSLHVSPEQRAEIVTRFVTMFSDDNPRFSPSKFRAACEPEPEPESEPQSLRAELSERDRIEAAASWVDIDSDETARRLLEGLENVDPMILDALPMAPDVSGQWAGEPTWLDILAEHEIEPGDDHRPELLDVFEYAYGCAVERDIVTRCRQWLGLFPSELRR